MPPKPTKQTKKALEAMTRAEVQHWAKEYGIRATGKTVDLIDAIIEAQKPASKAAAATAPATKPKKAPTATKAAAKPAAAPAPAPTAKAKKAPTAAAQKKAAAAAVAAAAKPAAAPVPKTVMRKGKCVVDEYFPNASSFHVVEHNGVVMDAMLNQVNTGGGNNNNKFIKLQVLQQDKGNRIVFWRRWGRVGAKGQSKEEAYATVDGAVNNFESKFREKSGNLWSNRDNFVKKSGKYEYIVNDYGVDSDNDEEDEDEDMDEEVKPAVCTLAPTVKSLVELICDLKNINKSLAELKYDATRMPLGKLAQEQIDRGKATLKAIEDAHKLKNGAKRLETIRALSDEYYTRIPHAFGMSRAPPLTTKELLQNEIDLLDVLENGVIAVKLLRKKKASETTAKVHPTDECYGNLHTELTPVDSKSAEFQKLDAYIQNTHGETHSHYKIQLVDLFRVEREGEAERFNPENLGNRQLLWHGSRLTNWCGILSQGLRIAPPEAPCTGYMFGKGVYFADCVSKSANYCYAYQSNNTAILTLCEVALGDQNKLHDSDSSLNKKNLPKGTYSTLGLGKTAPDPAGSLKWPRDFGAGDDADVHVPCGKAIQTGEENRHNGGYTLQYNEMIVYTTEQIRMRYVLRCKFT